VTAERPVLIGDNDVDEFTEAQHDVEQVTLDSKG
jgi:hypothetical protein